MSEDLPTESARTILFQFVIFPLGIVAIGVGVFLLFGALASERHTIRDDVEVLRSGSPQRRWQAAYELSKSLKRGEAEKYPDLHRDIESMWRDAGADPQLRRYLTLVLGRLGSPASIPVLSDGAKDADVETRIYSVWAMGEIGDPAAIGALGRAARDDSEGDVRKTAVWALGRLHDARVVPTLVGALDDSVTDVRWNAALALAELGDARAVPVLRQLLDRKALERVPGIRPDQETAAILAAIPAYARLAGADAKAVLTALATSDPDLEVQSAARRALDELSAPGE